MALLLLHPHFKERAGHPRVGAIRPTINHRRFSAKCQYTFFSYIGNSPDIRWMYGLIPLVFSPDSPEFP